MIEMLSIREGVEREKTRGRALVEINHNLVEISIYSTLS